MTQAGPTTKYFCKKCNRTVASLAANCPHCRGYATIAIGKPAEGSSAYVDEVPEKLSEIKTERFERISTGTDEFDRVLGGGLVTDSAVLLSGDPGIGKSTLLTQTLIDLTTAEITDDETGDPEEPFVVLYVHPEETKSQVKLRSDRLARGANELYLYRQNNVLEIARYVQEMDPDVLVIDSIQLVIHPDVEGTAGSVNQVRACADYLIAMCKSLKIALFIIAHINKDGGIAGPKTLEHLVDVVLEFHKEGESDLRTIRASKNRFGDTNEMALFRMTKEGLTSIANPSELLLEHHKDGTTGTCIGIAADGPRPLALEIQTLMRGRISEELAFEDAVHHELDELRRAGHEDAVEMIREALKKKRRREMSSGRAMVTGLDSKRVNQLIAVMESRSKVDCAAMETFVSVAGGIRVEDHGLDVPTALAIASFVFETSLPPSFCAFGEVGLGGEIRSVTYQDARIKAGILMGFQTIIGPVRHKQEPLFDTQAIDKLAEGSEGDITTDEDAFEKQVEERYIGVASLEELIAEVFRLDISTTKTKEGKRPEKKKKKKSSPLSLVPAPAPERVSIARQPRDESMRERADVSEAPPPI